MPLVMSNILQEVENNSKEDNKLFETISIGEEGRSEV